MLINFNKKFNTEKYKRFITNAYGAAMSVIKPKYQGLEVNVAFVSKRQIHLINKEFRNVDRPTDVLSFPTLSYSGDNGTIITGKDITKSNFASDINPETGNIMLGDIYICLPVCFRQAKTYKTGRQREVSYLAVHGLLHLLGYDHMTDSDKSIMREMEEKIMKKYFAHNN